MPARLHLGIHSMTMSFHAVFDGEVLRPDEPLALAPNTRVLITIDTKEEPMASPGKSFLETAASLNLEGPPDWSARLARNSDDCPSEPAK